MDSLLAKLSEQQAAIREQNEIMKRVEESAAFARAMEQQQTCSSLPITPGVEGYHGPSVLMGRSASTTQKDSTEELLRLKLELAQAQNKISRLDQELAHTRSSKREGAQNLSLAASEPSYPANPGVDQVLPLGIAGFPPPQSSRTLYNRDNIWSSAEEIRADTLDNISTGTIGRGRDIWRNDAKQSGLQQPFSAAPGSLPASSGPTGYQQPSIWPPARSAHHSFLEPASKAIGEGNGALGDNHTDRITPDNDSIIRPPSQRQGNRLDTRGPSSMSFPSYNSFGSGQMPFDMNAGFPPGNGFPGTHTPGLGTFPQYQQPLPPIGTPLSPHATEFNSDVATWTTEV